MWIVVVGALSWAGCSVEKNYDLLSLFFDGVPNPEALPVTAVAGDPATMRQSPTYVAHQPYIEQRCEACHESRFEQRAVSAGVCAKCHEGVGDEHEIVHGPVLAGACLWCHAAHESAYSWLLKEHPRTVCMQCHGQTLDSERVPAHADETRSCLECHMGHGGDDRYMLRTAGADERGG